MFTSPVSKISAVLLVLVVGLVTASFVTRSAYAPSVDRSYDNIEQLRAFRPSASHYDQIEQVRLGRSFNVSGDRFYDTVEGLRAFRLVDTLGYEQIETLRLQRGSNSLNIGSLYDQIEQVRLGRTSNASANR